MLQRVMREQESNIYADTGGRWACKYQGVQWLGGGYLIDSVPAVDLTGNQ